MIVSVSKRLYCQMISLWTLGGNEHQPREESILGMPFNTVGIVSSLGSFNSHPGKCRDLIELQRGKHDPVLWDIYFHSANLSSETEGCQYLAFHVLLFNSKTQFQIKFRIINKGKIDRNTKVNHSYRGDATDKM